MPFVIAADPVPLHVDDHGTIRVGGTRVTLDSVVGSFHQGATAEEIAQQYPVLSLADIYAVIGYYLRRRSEVDLYLMEQQREADIIHKQHAWRYDPDEIRQRLLARKHASSDN